MAVAPRWLRLPRPRTFMYIMSLRTGTEMIALSMVFNKVTGFYGILAILTGFSLSPLQLTMYLYSLAALILLAFLMPHIRKQTPFECLALAWFYVVDTVVNTAFTALFSITWLISLSEDTTHNENLMAVPTPGTPRSASGLFKRQGTPGEDVVAAVTTAEGIQTMAEAATIEETIPSIIIVILLTLVRVYFVFVVMAFARQALRQYMYSTSTAQKTQFRTDGTIDVPASNPFAVGRSAGQGWRGKLGRLMVSIGEGYWLGGQVDDDWAKGLDGRFRTRRAPSGPPGTIERERRARSGTGPPLPSPHIMKV